MEFNELKSGSSVEGEEIKAYRSLVYCPGEYASSAWDPHTNADEDKIERI